MISFANIRPDPRDEDDLHWRWTYAEGETARIPGCGNLEERSAKAQYTVDKCVLGQGLVHVPACKPSWHPSTDLDGRSLAAASRARRIDAQLEACDAAARTVLWRAYGAAPVSRLLGLCPLPAPVREGQAPHPAGPCLANLVELTEQAVTLHRRSRTTQELRPWLERLALRKAGADVRAELVLAAEALLLGAARQYGRVGQRMRLAERMRRAS